MVGATATDPEVKMDLAIWICVFLGTWYNNPAIETIAELRRTYGAHSRLATDTLPLGKLQQLFDSKECQGIGECGLDETAEDLKAQEKIFLVQVRAAQRTGKPLVLHIWAKAEDTGPLHAQVHQLVHMLGDMQAQRFRTTKFCICICPELGPEWFHYRVVSLLTYKGVGVGL